MSGVPLAEYERYRSAHLAYPGMQGAPLNPLTHNKQCLKPQLEDDFENDKFGIFGTMIIEKRRHCMQRWSE